MKRAEILGSFLLLLLLVADLAGSAESDRGRPPAEGHKEAPVAAPAVPVTRESQARSPQARVTTGLVQSVQVNVDAMQNNIVGDAANEPSIAIDPTNPNNIVIGWRQFGTIASDFRQAGMAYSHDGGATWTFPGPLDPLQFRSDPVLAADNAGNFFYYSLSSLSTTEYFVSLDKGVTWNFPVSSPGGDKNWHTIDNSGGLGDGHIYPLWNSQFTCCATGTDFSRSTQSALNFEGPWVLPRHPKWGTDTVGPDGKLYIVGVNLSGSGHVLLRSDDANDATGVPSFPVFSGVPLGGDTAIGATPNPGGLMGQVWVDVDRSAGPTRGNVYVLGSVDPTGTDPLDVHFVRSEDDGVTWSAPIRVNDDPAGNGAYQWFGTMSVSPEGRIDVAWNDTRNGSATMSELFYAYSTDAGLTFSAGLPVTPAFNSTVGHPVQNKIGDYYHMVSETHSAALAYSATFNGEQDVYFVRLGDCNGSGVHDSVDISTAASNDCNTNGVPDECDVGHGISDDINSNDIPDECETCLLLPPGEVDNLILSLGTTIVDLDWDAVPEAAGYAVYRGTQRDASDLACFGSPVATPPRADDGLVPASGEILFYVVTAVNCGGESILGSGRTATNTCP